MDGMVTLTSLSLFYPSCSRKVLYGEIEKILTASFNSVAVWHSDFPARQVGTMAFMDEPCVVPPVGNLLQRFAELEAFPVAALTRKLDDALRASTRQARPVPKGAAKPNPNPKAPAARSGDSHAPTGMPAAAT